MPTRSARLSAIAPSPTTCAIAAAPASRPRSCRTSSSRSDSRTRRSPASPLGRSASRCAVRNLPGRSREADLDPVLRRGLALALSLGRGTRHHLGRRVRQSTRMRGCSRRAAGRCRNGGRARAFCPELIPGGSAPLLTERILYPPIIDSLPRAGSPSARSRGCLDAQQRSDPGRSCCHRLGKGGSGRRASRTSQAPGRRDARRACRARDARPQRKSRSRDGQRVAAVDPSQSFSATRVALT